MATKLKEARRAAGMMQKELADAAGLPLRTLQHYEQGRRNLDGAALDTILNLCIALRCTPDQLVDNPEVVDLWQRFRDMIRLFEEKSGCK
jgi:transcriptional regulator with XRE-family HTH domain